MKAFDRSLVARITASAALVATMLICVSVAMLVHLDIRQAKGTLAGKADLSGQMVADAVSAAVWNLSPEEAAVALVVAILVRGSSGAIALLLLTTAVVALSFTAVIVVVVV